MAIETARDLKKLLAQVSVTGRVSFSADAVTQVLKNLGSIWATFSKTPIQLTLVADAIRGLDDGQKLTTEAQTLAEQIEQIRQKESPFSQYSQRTANAKPSALLSA